MKGIIKGNTIVMEDQLPEGLQKGERVEVHIVRDQKKIHSFPTFRLSIKDEYLHRERLYENPGNSPASLGR